MAAGDSDELSQELIRLTEYQVNSWAEGNDVGVEALLQEQPTISESASAVLDLIYSEVLLREERGESPTVAEYAGRFPELTESLERQFQLHRVLQQSEAAEIDSLDIQHGSTQPTGSLGPDDFVPTITIPGFELLEVAGRGGTGIVYRARDTRLNRTVAIKLIAGGELSDTDVRKQLIREAEAAARLRHPNIARIYSIGDHQAGPCLIMEYVSGGTLAQLLHRGLPSITDAVATTLTVADAVQYAHDSGVVHRDLKPGNILLDDSLRPFVSDFGLARRLDVSQTFRATGDVVGTPAYMAPEQARGESVDARVDVYSLGALLYELLTGRPPFQAATPWDILRQVMMDDPLPPHALNSSLPRDLNTICMQCLQKDPSRRYTSVAAMAEDLQRFTDRRSIVARPASPVQHFLKWCRRNRGVAAMSGVSLALLAVLGIGSTLFAIRLSSINADLQAEKQRVEQARHQATTDRAAALTALDTLAKSAFDELTADAASIASRQTVVDAVISGLQNLAQLSGDRDADRTAMIAHQRMADLMALSGDHAGAEQNYLEAVSRARRLLSTAPDELTASYDVVRAHSILAMHYQVVGKDELADEYQVTARRYLDQMLRRWPDEVGVRRYLVNQHQRRLDNMWKSAAPAETLAYGEQALEDVEHLLQISDDPEEDLALASSICQRVGRAAIDLYQPDLAMQYFDQASEHEAAILRSFDDTSFHRKSRAFVDRAAAAARLMQGRPEEAVAVTSRSVNILRELAAGDAADLIRQKDLMDGLLQHANSLIAAGRIRDAQRSLIEAVAIGTELLQNSPDTESWMRTQAECYVKLTDTYLRQGKWSEAHRTIEQAITVLQRTDADSQLAMALLIQQPLLLLSGSAKAESSPDGEILALCLVGLADAQTATEEQLSESTVDVVREVTGLDVRTFDALLTQISERTPSHPAVSMIVPVISARILGLRARNLAGVSDESSGRESAILLQRCLDIIRSVSQTQPSLIPQLIATEPDLNWVRSTPEYRAGGLTRQ